MCFLVLRYIADRCSIETSVPPPTSRGRETSWNKPIKKHNPRKYIWIIPHTDLLMEIVGGLLITVIKYQEPSSHHSTVPREPCDSSVRLEARCWFHQLRFYLRNSWVERKIRQSADSVEDFMSLSDEDTGWENLKKNWYPVVRLHWWRCDWRIRQFSLFILAYFQSKKITLWFHTHRSNKSRITSDANLFRFREKTRVCFCSSRPAAVAAALNNLGVGGGTSSQRYSIIVQFSHSLNSFHLGKKSRKSLSADSSVSITPSVTPAGESRYCKSRPAPPTGTSAGFGSPLSTGREGAS